MIVKKLGWIFLFRLKLLQIVATLSPILIVLVLMSYPYILDMGSKFKFQQPSLNMKLYDIQNPLLTYNCKLQTYNQNIQYRRFPGLLNYESILITYYDRDNNAQFIMKDLIYTLENDHNLGKNVVVVKYSQKSALKKLLDEMPIDWGIIRAAFDADIAIRGNRAFFKYFGKNGLLVDEDFYHFSQQLLGQLHIDWSACEDLYKYSWIKYIRNYIRSVFLDNVLCQLCENFKKYEDQSISNIFLNKGIQAATIRIVQSKGSKNQYIQNSKISKFMYSFAKVFHFQQDHLHSAGTIYLPVSRDKYIQQSLYQLPILACLLIVAMKLATLVWTNYQQLSTKLTIIDMIIFMMISCEWLYFNSLKYSWIGILVLGIIGVKQNSDYRNYVLLGIQGFITYYLSVFNFSLSLLSFAAVIMLFFNLNFICWVMFVGVYLKCLLIDQEIPVDDTDVSMAFLPFLLATLIRKVK